MALFHTVVNSIGGSNAMPRPARAAIYRLMGVHVQTMNIFSGCRITSPRLTLGAGTFLNHECYLDAADGSIEIGRNCLLSPRVMILASTHDLESGGPSRKSHPTRTVVGDGVWLGAGSVVLPGVTIADDCVIAAGAVVSKDCASGGLYAGVPAQRVRDL